MRRRPCISKPRYACMCLTTCWLSVLSFRSVVPSLSILCTHAGRHAHPIQAQKHKRISTCVALAAQSIAPPLGPCSLRMIPYKSRTHMRKQHARACAHVHALVFPKLGGAKRALLAGRHRGSKEGVPLRACSPSCGSYCGLVHKRLGNETSAVRAVKKKKLNDAPCHLRVSRSPVRFLQRTIKAFLDTASTAAA